MPLEAWRSDEPEQNSRAALRPMRELIPRRPGGPVLFARLRLEASARSFGPSTEAASSRMPDMPQALHEERAECFFLRASMLPSGNEGGSKAVFVLRCRVQLRTTP